MLQVDTSKDKVQGQRWDFCWQRNSLQVPEQKFWHQTNGDFAAFLCNHSVLYRFVYIALVSFSLLQSFSFHLTVLSGVHTIVTSSGGAEGYLFSFLEVFCNIWSIQPLLRRQTKPNVSQKSWPVVQHTVNVMTLWNVILQTQLL